MLGARGVLGAKRGGGKVLSHAPPMRHVQRNQRTDLGFSSVEVIPDPNQSCCSKVLELRDWVQWVPEQMGGKDWETASINNLFQEFC